MPDPPGVPLASVATTTLVLELCAAENAGRWSDWRALVAEDVFIDHPGLGVVIGAEANLALVRGFHDAVRSYRREVFDVVGDAGAGAFRFTITGSLVGTFDGRLPAAAGLPVDIAGAAFVNQRGGRLVRVVELVTRGAFVGEPARA